MRVLSGKSDGSEDIHNQIDPQELHYAERRMTKDQSGGYNEDDAGDVNSHLELDELAHVVLNVTTVADRSDDSLEVVVHEDDIGVILSSRAAILTHCETNAGLAERAGIAESFASNTNSGTRLSEGTDKHAFKVRSGSVN